MLDLSTNRPKTHLSDLLRRSPSSSSDIFANHYEPINRGRPLTFTPDDAATDEGGSGASTPPLWRHSSPPGSPDRIPTASALYSSLSPRSRTQAIARGQMELMEMVKKMPESCYELSLKDLVEINHRQPAAARAGPATTKGGGARRIGGRMAVVGQQKMVRSGSVDNNNGGFMLKMVFPVTWGTRKKKSDFWVNNNSLRASPVSDKEWWNKRGGGSAGFASTESESGESSLNGGSRKSSSSSSRSSSANSSSRRFEEISDCWSFIRMKKANNP